MSDPFGPGTAIRPWDDGTNSVANAQRRVRVAFEFIEKLGAPFYCFHDRDVAPEGSDLRETNKNLDAVVKVLKEEQQRTGIKLLWGTANLFSNPRYVHGAATSCNADVFAFAAAQVKKALEVTHGTRRRGLRLLGRARRLFDAAQYRPQARTGSSREIPAHGGGLQEADRLQRPVLHRAQAEGADETPIRLRRRRLPEFPPRIRSARPLPTQHRDQPRDAGGPHDAARTCKSPPPPARWARSTPTRATNSWAGTPTNSQPTSI